MKHTPLVSLALLLIISAAIVGQFVPRPAFAVAMIREENCYGPDIGCWMRYAAQQARNNAGAFVPAQVLQDPQPIPASTPAAIVSDPNLTEGQAGTAKLCSAYLLGGSDNCVILSASDASAKVQSLVDISNQETSSNSNCQQGGNQYYGGNQYDNYYGGYQQQCDSIPPPTINRDAQGRVVYVACGNGGATAEVTYYDGAASTCSLQQGSTCTSGANSCGMTTTSTVQCDGSCPAITPDNSQCPAPGPVIEPATPVETGGTGGNGGQPAPAPALAPEVAPEAAPPAPPPSHVSAILSADPLSIVYGLFSTLAWLGQDAVSCTGSPAPFDTGGSTSGTITVSPAATTMFILTCEDSAGNKAYSTQTVAVDEPQISLTASPTLVQSGTTSIITWSASGKVDSCTMTGPNLSSSASSGSSPQVIRSESTYTFSCTAGSFHPTKSVTVKVTPSYQEI